MLRIKREETRNVLGAALGSFSLVANFKNTFVGDEKLQFSKEVNSARHDDSLGGSQKITNDSPRNTE